VGHCKCGADARRADIRQQLVAVGKIAEAVLSGSGRKCAVHMQLVAVAGIISN